MLHLISIQLSNFYLGIGIPLSLTHAGGGQGGASGEGGGDSAEVSAEIVSGSFSHRDTGRGTRDTGHGTRGS